MPVVEQPTINNPDQNPVQPTIGPDQYAAIKDVAALDAKEMLDQILTKLSYGIWHNGYYFIAEDSYAYISYEYLKMEMQNYKFVNSAIVPASIIDSYNTVKSYGPMPAPATIAATAVFTVAKLLGYDNGMPDYSTAITIVRENQSMGVAIALAKFNYVMNSDYRYLMVGFEGRSDFLDRLNLLSDQIQQSDYNIYSTSEDNAAYQAALLDYINNISDMNNNFDITNEMLKAQLQAVEDAVTQIDAETINKQLLQ